MPLADLPPCEPNTSSALCVLAIEGTVWLAYDSRSPDSPDSDAFSVVRISHCSVFRGGGPNDEAFHNHPLYNVVEGLSSYQIQEIVDSPWIEEQARILHKQRLPDAERTARTRHLFFALKEEVFECLAESYSVDGTFATPGEAVDAILRAAPGALR